MTHTVPNFVKQPKLILLFFFLIFPIFLNYMSPYVIIAAASEGIMNGSMITFLVMLISSLFFGRLWCGWGCPAGAVQECAFEINPKPVNEKKLNWIKWVIWGLWISLIVFMLVRAGDIHTVDPFFYTENDISVMSLEMYIIYYGVLALIVVPSLLVGKRMMCHTLCWMAPFMIVGRKISNRLNLPAVRLKARSEECIHCGRCTSTRPISLDVQSMVEARDMENTECVFCKNCVASCPKDLITLKIAKRN